MAGLHLLYAAVSNVLWLYASLGLLGAITLITRLIQVFYSSKVENFEMVKGT